jgi:alpha-beta hydrolase superfamily lysophospholipase
MAKTFQFGRVRWRRWLGVVAGLLLLLAMAVLLGPRNAYGPDTPSPRAAPPGLAQLDTWLQASEARYSDLRPGTAKGIVWHGAAGQRTPWAVVYLHGFSASRLEVAPLPERVAQALGANVYYARLAGNGRSGLAMGEATVQDWLADTVEAARIGQLLGDKVLLIATSTGGTLGTWLATRPEGRGISAYAFISPNYGPKDKRSELINGPWGQQLALALEGDMRGQPSTDAREEVAWTTRYATRALFPMMALVKHVRESDLSSFVAPALVLYSKGDQTVDPVETEQVFARMGSAQKTLEAVTYSEAKGQHVLAGDIRAPKATEPMAQRVVAWVRSLPQ